VKNLVHAAEHSAAAVSGTIFVISALAFIIPLAAAVSPLFTGSTGTVSFSPHTILGTVLYTFKIAAGSTLIAAAVGIPVAFFTSRRYFFGRKLILSLAAVPLCIPILIIALGFVSTFGMHGIVNTGIMKVFNLKEPPARFLYSTAGVIIAQGFYNFPFVTAVVTDCWSSLPDEEQNAARMLGAPEQHIFLTVTLPELTPAIASACIPVFLYCFFSFMIVLLFGNIGGTTLEVEVYQAARTTLDYRNASLFALIETSCALATVLIYSSVIRNQAKSRGKSYENTKNRHALPGCAPYESRSTATGERFFFIFLMLLITFFFLMPLAGIALGSLTGTEGPRIFLRLFADKGFRCALLGTIETAPMAGILCCITAFVYAVVLRNHDPDGRNALLQTIPLLPMAVSSVIMGYGIDVITGQSTAAVLVIAQTALCWPVAFRQIYTELARIPQDTVDASYILSQSRLDTIFRVYLPSSKTALLSSFGFCFAVSMGDTTLPLVLSIPNFDTLALYTYRLAGSYRFTSSCACGVLLCMLCAFVFSIGKKI
jgi:thiamine transport system permease protein